jgi:hypothetical protein
MRLAALLTPLYGRIVHFKGFDSLVFRSCGCLASQNGNTVVITF